MDRGRREHIEGRRIRSRRSPRSAPLPRRATVWILVWLVFVALASNPPASAEPPPTEHGELDRPAAGSLLTSLFSPKPIGRLFLELRPRYEYADQEGSRSSNALTLRTHLGFGTRTWRGLSALIEGESVLTADQDWYDNGVGTPNRRTVITDPKDTDVNRAYLSYEHVDARARARVGRQRIILDDARFVGNVDWRQNEQTFDAARVGLQRSLPLAYEVQLEYAYVDRVLRIFGDKGTAPTRDFRSDSHLIRAQLGTPGLGRFVAFGYLLDFENSASGSSATVGLRWSHRFEVSKSLGIATNASFAYQRDYQDQPIDYDATYQAFDVALEDVDLGSVGLGFERLGSDDGRIPFGTPLATLHNFNGWADAFLDNGGPAGLRDYYAILSPKLPWRLEALLVAHWYQSDQPDRRLGWELDAQVRRPVTPWLSVLAKLAHFDGRARAGRPDLTRFWLQASLEF